MTGARPTLSGASARRVFDAVLSDEKRDPRRERLKKDWKAFFEEEFHLSATQRTNLGDIAPGESEKIRRAFIEAADQGGQVRLTLGSPSQSKGGSLTIDGARNATGAVRPRLKITLLRCTFDANCRNWKCKFGPEIPPIR